MPTVMITGSNRGLGLECARQYADEGWRVIATCRNPGNAVELASLKGELEIHALDISDHGQILSLADSLREEAIDLLFNNAGIFDPSPSQLVDIDYKAWENFISVNVMSPLMVCATFSDHVAASDLKHKPITLIAGDSTSDETILKAKALGPYDFLFIDGGHTDEILNSDYVNYTKLMKQNSLIVVHDIYSSSYPTLNLVWNKIKNSLPPNAVFKEFIRESAPITLGIGAIYLKEGNY